ncbi:MAG: hypothetical protein ABWJ42_02890 [Sulfolobales archaeon]
MTDTKDPATSITLENTRGLREDLENLSRETRSDLILDPVALIYTDETVYRKGLTITSVTADQIVDLFERDVRARKRLAELLVAEPDVRLAIINAVLRDVATKEDIKSIEVRISSVERQMVAKDDLRSLESRVHSIESRVATREDIKNMATKDDLKALESRVSLIERQMATKDDIKTLEERVRVVEDRLLDLAKIVSELRGAYTELGKRIDDLGKRIDDLDKRIDALDRRIDSLDKRIDALDKRIDSLDKRIDSLDKRLDFAVKITLLLTGSVLAALVTEIIVRLVFSR